MYNTNQLFLNYAQPQDIAQRIFRRKPYWFHGPPSFSLLGENGEFGVLKLDFGDEVYEWTIYISDKERIENAVQLTIDNFEYYVSELLEIIDS